MNTEQTNKTEECLKNLSDQDLSMAVKELEGEYISESSVLRELITNIYGDEVGIFVLRVNNIMYPLLKEVHSRWNTL